MDRSIRERLEGDQRRKVTTPLAGTRPSTEAAGCFLPRGTELETKLHGWRAGHGLLSEIPVAGLSCLAGHMLLHRKHRSDLHYFDVWRTGSIHTLTVYQQIQASFFYWLCWVLTAGHRLSQGAVTMLCRCRLHLLRCGVSVTADATWDLSPDQGSDLYPLHCKADGPPEQVPLEICFRLILF